MAAESDQENASEMDENVRDPDSLLGILHSKHYSNILKSVYASASSTYDPLAQFHPSDIHQSDSPTSSIQRPHPNTQKPNIAPLQFERTRAHQNESSSFIQEKIPETRPKQTPFVKPAYSLRVPRGLPFANKLLNPPVYPRHPREEEQAQQYQAQSQDAAEPVQRQIVQSQSEKVTKSMAASESQQEIMPVHTDTNTPEIIQQLHDSAHHQNVSYRVRSDSSLLNDEENFINLAILDAYKYRTNRPLISVSKHLIENVKCGSMPTQRVGIHHSPSTYHLNSALLEFNDKSGRHPLSRLRKSDLTTSDKNYVLNYHKAHQQKVSANKSIHERILLNGHNPETGKYELKYNEDELYSLESRPSIKTPLETFDQQELEPLDLDSMFDIVDGGKATKEISGFARYYKDKAFIWHKCSVLAYDRLNGKFSIKFIVKEADQYIKSSEEEIKEENELRASGKDIEEFRGQQPQKLVDKVVTKQITRLHLRFEEEDESGFNERVASAQRRKDAFLALRRYWDFIALQSDSSISSINPETFQRILHRLDSISDIILENEQNCTDLLINVKEDYHSAMKAALLEYARINPTEKARMKGLSLPIMKDQRREMEYGTIEVGHREFMFGEVSQHLSSWLFFKHLPLNKTLLEISKDFHSICSKNCLIKISNYGAPIPMKKFKERQDDHLVAMQDLLIVDWREKAISLVRDIDLGDDFDFFVKSRKLFERIPLYRFLKRTQFLMRQQLVHYIVDSVEHWVQFIEAAAKHIHCAPSALSTEYTRFWPIDIKSQCFFLYSLTTDQKNKVCFEPRLNTLGDVCQSVMNIPYKFEGINNIDTVLVPFVGIPTQPMVKKNTCSHLFDYIRQSSKRLQKSIDCINEEVLAIQALYQQYEYMLNLDAAEYATEWFAEADFSFTDSRPGTAASSMSRMSHGSGRMTSTDHADEDKDDENGVALKDTMTSVTSIAIQKPRIAHTVDETKEEIQTYWNAIEEIHVVTPQQVQFSLLELDCSAIQKTLISAAQNIVDELLDGTRRETDTLNQYILDLTENQLKTIEKKCGDIEDLSALQVFIKQVNNTTLPALKSYIEQAAKRNDLLVSFHTNLNEEQFDKLWRARACPKRLVHAMERQQQIIIDEEEKFKEELQREQDSFMLELRKYAEQVEEFSTFGPCDDAEMEKRARSVDKISEKLEKAKDKAKAFNRKEQLFKMPQTEYADLEMTIISFEPYSKLWRTTSLFVANHNVWTSGAFNELNAKQIENDIRQWYSALHKLEKKLKADAKKDRDSDSDTSPSAEVCNAFKQRINDFRKHLPIISNLRNPGLRKRHWQKLSDVLEQQTIDPEKFLTYNILLQFNITEHKEEIEEICTVAEKEFSLEQALDNMASEWAAIEFELKDHRGTFILRGLDEVMEKLDDHIVKTQTMKGSPYIEPFKVRIDKWEKLLQLVSASLDEWLQVQKTWMYLEPIFGSPDIMRQMPKEGKQFQVVDNVWKTTMKECVENASVLEFAGRDNLLKAFAECNKILDKIQKGLNDYLETKRLAFPRFYFLSNDELLEILSQTKNVQAVQPHLSKCFDGLVKVEFGENDIIKAMISAEGEVVPFLKPVDPNFGDAKGNVEVWLNDVQKSMMECLKDSMLKAYKAYPQQARKEWILVWPAQVVLAVSQCYWTSQVESAIKTKGNRGLKEYVKKLNMQLKDIVQLVRGKLTKLQRKTIGPLVVIDVHARDVIQEMIDQNVSSTEDFEWMAQLRYYMQSDDTLMVKMINANLKYGYEYLGNSGRLVITPLTDRCYRTLMGALKLNYGGAPEGPAGTGKTETVKDLAKALAKQCIVFNCSDSLDYLAMAKFFKGLASSGAWSCFDEFNRINLEVLSVIAQQILTIQMAIREGKHRFWFEGVELPLIHSCSVFITMNPGYAGRSDLPDNLKALFRTVAMMVPDYALIAEIMLYSYGYSDARVLSKKLVSSLRLSSEQLSSQYHYDFGMRNVKSILVAAGNLKRQFVKEREDLLVLRAINDCNLSKFTSEDIPLFKGITKDLFPGVELPEPDYASLSKAITENCVKLNLQPKDTFVTRCLQIYETAAVRHGFMVVGDTYSGKSNAIKVMTSAMCDLAESKELTNAVKINRFTINPKAQSMNRLYGAFDEATHEWANGVLAKTIRECAANQSSELKWIVFDGPVDTLWIENMNTVLDDNKKLCLASGEIIKLSSTMSIVFEVDDLSVASPATISRVGMVFLEPKQLGWRPIVLSWYNTLPEAMQPLQDKFQALFEALFQPTVEFVLENTSSIIHLTAEGHVTNLLRLLNTTLDPFKEEEKVTSAMWGYLEAFFTYSLIWSVGANTNADGRCKFSVFLTELLSNLPHKVEKPLPVDAKKENISVYDFVFSLEKKKWIQWMDISGKFEIAPTAKFENITVPTVDTVRSSYLLESLLVHHYRTLFTGPTGTGKSKIIYQKLMDELPKDKWDPICITFSAQTTELQAQLTVQDKLVKRTKTMRGPILGKQAVLFIDDLNMPEKEEFGAQPPLELFRQFCDYSGWYHENIFLKLVDVQMVAAMGTPGGGANVPTTRLTRHFNIIGFVPYDDSSLQRIFSTIVNWWCRQSNLTSLSKIIPKMVNATVDIYSTLKQELKPTPEKSHYTFNLRDMSKVFGGILSSAPKFLKSQTDLIRVWSHECQRVFSDRLISSKDIQWFNSVLSKKSETHFKIDFVSDILDGEKEKTLFFTHFHTEADPPEYAYCQDYTKLKAMLEESLDDYNQISGSPMDLVLFQDAISHICRISRVMNQPAGSALLVGVGGSGRQSLTKLATAIAEYELFQVQVSTVYAMIDWKEDLKKLFYLAGLEGKQVVFLFNDTQIKFESMLEDINNILNNGEVPGLFASEDMPQIIDTVGDIAKKEGKPTDLQNVLALFVERCKKNIHIFLCLSPIGDKFRTRLRRFPSLVNCCTIDWFHRWPEQALKSVANRYLHDVEIKPDIKEKVVNACVTMQESVIETAADFLFAYRINTYVTPTSYLDLLQTFKNLFEKTRTKIGVAKNRYDIGLDKLKSTQTQVKEMQQQLEELQPQLEESVLSTNKLMKEIEIQTKDADAKKEIVAVEEKQCNAQAAEAKEQADECQKELDVALPAYEQAMAALKVIKKSDLAQVKKYSKPPPGVILTMEAVCIMMQVKPKKVGEVGKKVDDYWDQSKKYVLGDTKLLDKLQNYDKDNIPTDIIKKVSPYVENPDFDPEKVATASGACKGLCLWVRALHTYDRVAKVVKPKQEALKKAQSEVAEAMANLAKKKAELKKITDLLANLNEKFTAANAKKEDLQNQVEVCAQRLDRAEKLISGLGGEYKSWSIKSEDLAKDFENVVGDIVIASGVIAYLGIYTSTFRQKTINKWVQYLKNDLDISCADPFSLVNTLGDPIQIREWIISKLPKDEFSITNAIIYDKSIKFPLFVDPQVLY